MLKERFTKTITVMVLTRSQRRKKGRVADVHMGKSVKNHGHTKQLDCRMVAWRAGPLGTRSWPETHLRRAACRSALLSQRRGTQKWDKPRVPTHHHCGGGSILARTIERRVLSDGRGEPPLAVPRKGGGGHKIEESLYGNTPRRPPAGRNEQ